MGPEKTDIMTGNWMNSDCGILAKTSTQIRMDMNSKLSGDEIGLMVYIPFEGYYEDNLGVIQQQTNSREFCYRCKCN